MQKQVSLSLRVQFIGHITRYNIANIKNKNMANAKKEKFTMSIHYDIREHIIITNTEERQDIQDVFANHLIRIGTAMLDDYANIHKFQVIIDGENKEFSGKTLTADFHEIIRAVKSASSIDAVMDYGYYQYGGFVISNNSIQVKEYADMFDIKEHIENGVAEYGNEYLNGLFYSIYHNVDCSEDAGVVNAYGEKDGNLYTGDIESKIITTLPDGVWYSPTTAVIYDQEDVENINDVAYICQEMTKFSSYDELEVNENSISLYLNNLELKNNDELVKFVELCKQLTKATDGESFGTDELGLTDLSSDDGRIVNIKINEDGTHQISIQSTDF